MNRPPCVPLLSHGWAVHLICPFPFLQKFVQRFAAPLRLSANVAVRAKVKLLGLAATTKHHDERRDPHVRTPARPLTQTFAY